MTVVQWKNSGRWPDLNLGCVLYKGLFETWRADGFKQGPRKKDRSWLLGLKAAPAWRVEKQAHSQGGSEADCKLKICSCDPCFGLLRCLRG